MTELRRLDAREQAALREMEQHLSEDAPALDLALTAGTLRVPSRPPRAWRSRSAWPFAVLAAVAALLVVVGTTSTDVLLVAAGTWLLAASPLGLWLPLNPRKTS